MPYACTNYWKALSRLGKWRRQKENTMNAKSLAAITSLAAVILGLFGFLWSIKQDIVGIHRDIVGIHRDIVGIHRDIGGIHRDMGSLRERMARIEVIIEGFTGQAAPTAAVSSMAQDLSKADARKADLRKDDLSKPELSEAALSKAD